MELKDIRELVRMLDKSSLTKLEISKDDFKLKLEKEKELQILNGGGSAPMMPMPASPAAPAPAAPATPAADAPAEAAKGNYEEIKSPMVGTFYAAPSPDADPFVKVGDTISEGQTLCIIEAMKLMNEIKAEKSGKIVEILVQNSDPVEYNQVLFHIE